ncbi:Signal transduction histidine kinase [Thermodesulforhabdus norvegica]|uniref:histidine kinase n=1 Tax=Thermodesulforhabdus norvegica TaxID=39841 RepID=A0A1I4SNB9_9BACT|nr:Signal transduction histidine kinase [Thermodesulforhabdus norvegica]
MRKGVKRNIEELERVQPFELVKFLSLSSLVVVLVSTFILSAFIARGVKEIILRKSEEYAALVAENLNYQVWYQFTLPVLIVEKTIELRRPQQYERLDRVVRTAIHGLSVEKVNIYDLNQILTYSTESDDLGKKVNLGDIFKRVTAGESVSVFEGGKSFLGFEWPWGKRAFRLKTYIPMWEERPFTWKRGKILGVFEVIQDVSRDYEMIFRFQWFVIGGFTVFCGVLLVALALIAKRAEIIIERRAEERQRLRERLHRAEHLATLGEMIASVSHEIKNPLGIINSTAQLLQNRLSDEKQKRLAGIIIEEASRLNNIVVEFLDFARPKEPQIAPCDVEEILNRILATLTSQWSSSGIRVEKSFSGAGVRVQADELLLYRAFYNIITNALQAMEKTGGTLTVETKLDGFDGIRAGGMVNGEGSFLVTVRDTGPGIDDSIRDKIFRPFFTTKERGTGLGLAIVRSIVEEHGGEIFVESAEGKGTAVTVKIPLREAERRDEANSAGGG